MAFWDIFKDKKNDSENLSTIHLKVKDLLPGENETNLIKTACISGLLARVATIDFEVHQSEVLQMTQSLIDWGDLTKIDAENVVKIALEEITNLAGLENHKYCHPLNDIMEPKDRYSLVKALFSIAASDGSVDESESEEIRVICMGLRLQHQDFISARASVLDKIRALRKDP